MGDRRTDLRIPTFEVGVVTCRQSCLMENCLITGKSQNGATLLIIGTVSLPPEFDLTFKRQMRTHLARLIWQLDGKAGVAIDANARPPLVISIDANGYVLS